MEKKILDALSPVIFSPLGPWKNQIKPYLKKCSDAVRETLMYFDGKKSEYVSCGPHMSRLITEVNISPTSSQELPIRRTKTWDEVKKLLNRSNIVLTVIKFYITGQGEGFYLQILTQKGEFLQFFNNTYANPPCITLNITNYGVSISPSSKHTLQFVANFLLQNNWRAETFTGYHQTSDGKLLGKFIQDYLLDLQKTKIKQQRQKQTEKMPIIEKLFKQQQQQPLLDFSHRPKEIKQKASVIEIAKQLQQASKRKTQEQQQNERIWRSWIGQG